MGIQLKINVPCPVYVDPHQNGWKDITQIKIHNLLQNMTSSHSNCIITTKV